MITSDNSSLIGRDGCIAKFLQELDELARCHRRGLVFQGLLTFLETNRTHHLSLNHYTFGAPEPSTATWSMSLATNAVHPVW